jgi:glycosyltransferase involved in cell wall biosynthesis
LNSDLKFIYFTPADIQVPRVDRQGVVHFCEAVYRLGIDLELVAIGIHLLETEMQAEHPLAHYRIKKRFPVRMVQTSIHQRTQDNHAVRTALTRLRVDIAEGFRYLRATPRERRLLFFMKNYGPAAAFLLMRALTRKRLLLFFESHTVPRRFHQRFILKRMDGVIANSFALGRDLAEQHGIPRERVLGIHQGIDLDLVAEERLPKEDARRTLGLPLDKKIVVYTGKIYWGYREVEYLLEAARLTGPDVEFVMVGGRADHVERYRELIANEKLTNVRFTGFVSPTSVQSYLSAADVLILYYPTGLELNKYRSPGKLFEYMASGSPIVAADFPVLHEILGENPPAVLIPPDSPPALASAIRSVVDGGDTYTAMAARALERVKLFSWEARARTILDFIDARSAARGWRVPTVT